MPDPAVPENSAGSAPHLRRRLGLLQATALNMANMVGVGPFLTIPLIVAAMPGPQVILAWATALVLCLADSMMWCELGAAMPGSGGTYHYLREVFRGRPLGRLLPFLFIWQFIFSGPLEVASGCIGFVTYLGELWPATWPALSVKAMELTAAGKVGACLVAALAVFLLYRRIGSIGKLTVALWAGMLVTVLLVIVTCAWGFRADIAFGSGHPAAGADDGFLWAFGAALGIAMYDFLGYYDVCYLGDEVVQPARTIPRAVVLSVLVVALLYAAINIGALGVLPIDQLKDSLLAADLMKAVWDSQPMVVVATLLILWTAFASVFALLLGYSRIPYAAACDGYFFRVFSDLHPRKEFPRLSLLVMGLVTIAACWFSFGDVLTALLTSRILAQFVAQIGAVVAVRRLRPDIVLPFRMWLYPLPCVVALVGWIAVFVGQGKAPMLYGLVTLLVGILAFFLIFRRGRDTTLSARP